MVKVKLQDSTETKILGAARKVFIAKGMAGARMQDIANEAGINKALLHYYFRNKEKLFETIFLEMSIRFWPQVNMIFESEMLLFEKIESFCEAYIDKIIENPFLPLFVLNELNRHPAVFVKKLWKSGPPNVKKLVAQIDIEVKAGNIIPVSPIQLLMNMISLCVFPFLGKPMFQLVLGLDETQYRQLMQLRKKEVPRFIISSIKK